MNVPTVLPPEQVLELLRALGAPAELLDDGRDGRDGRDGHDGRDGAPAAPHAGGCGCGCRNG